MVAEADIFLGFDPGGRRKFGVALLQGENASASTCSGIGEAVSWALNECRNTKPVAAGFDTLLHWSTNNGVDALLSAWATREGYADGWQDLVSADVNDQIFPVGEVNYLWPRTRSTT
jgi:hypothetical protein